MQLQCLGVGLVVLHGTTCLGRALLQESLRLEKFSTLEKPTLTCVRFLIMISLHKVRRKGILFGSRWLAGAPICAVLSSREAFLRTCCPSVYKKTPTGYFYVLLNNPCSLKYL